MAWWCRSTAGPPSGTSSGSQNVARRVASYHARGDQVVVVVSAMSGQTDGLIELAHQITPRPAEREMDVLMSTGEQVTIALLPSRSNPWASRRFRSRAPRSKVSPTRPT